MTGSEDERWGSSDEDEGERPVEADDNEPANEQASQWLKAILPEMTNGWWDVYPKGRGFAVKFCWRDPERQTLTFPRISYEQFQTLKQSAPDEVEKSTNIKSLTLKINCQEYCSCHAITRYQSISNTKFVASCHAVSLPVMLVRNIITLALL